MQHLGSVVVPELNCSQACGIFLTRGQMRVSCIGRWIPIHCTVKEVLLPCLFFKIFEYLKSFVCGCIGSQLWHTGYRACRLSSFGAGALQLWMHGLSYSTACGILVPPLGIKPQSPTLEGRFLTTGPPGRYPQHHLLKRPSFLHCLFLPPLS